MKRKAQIKPYLVLDSNLGVGHAEFGRQVCVKVSSIEETDLSVLWIHNHRSSPKGVNRAGMFSSSRTGWHASVKSVSSTNPPGQEADFSTSAWKPSNCTCKVKQTNQSAGSRKNSNKQQTHEVWLFSVLSSHRRWLLVHGLHFFWSHSVKIKTGQH